METKDLIRKFLYNNNGNNIILDDPNPDFTPNRVKEFYSNTYPELLNATVDNPKIENDNLIYEFNTKIGTKG